KMARADIEISSEVLRNFQRKKRLNTNWVHTGVPPMILSEKDVEKNLVTDLGILKVTIDQVKGQHLFYKKIFNELLVRLEKSENRVSDMEENIQTLNNKINDQALEIKELKRKV